MARFFYTVFFCVFLYLLPSALNAKAAQPAAQNQTPEKLRTQLVAAAKQYVGVPYKYGGLTTAGMDCSGFIYTVAREAATVQLPRTAHAMYSFCRIVPDSQKEPGDILFFKNGGTKITHAGLYIGNNQFIHAVSDGANTGVIVSSLNQTTWKQKYAGCGQFLPATLSGSASSAPSSSGTNSTSGRNEKGPVTKPVKTASFTGISNSILFDFSGYVRWQLYAADKFGLIVRGAGLQARIRYEGKIIKPGIGTEFRMEPLMGIYQFPLFLTIGFPRGFYLYAGPVFTIGKPHLIGTEESLSASVFPGIFGIGWQSPGLQVEKSKISFIQDINWAVFNKADKTRLDFKKGTASGLSFSTGIRVTISAKDLFD